MATPASHKVTAETALSTTIDAAPSVAPLDTDVVIAQAHAVLAGKLGTGAHYTAAETAIASYSATRGSTYGGTITLTRFAQSALLNATLAD